MMSAVVISIDMIDHDGLLYVCSFKLLRLSLAAFSSEGHC